eukprot:Filipodium_phascolosomae@DN177_c0_g1_i1.p1
MDASKSETGDGQRSTRRKSTKAPKYEDEPNTPTLVCRGCKKPIGSSAGGGLYRYKNNEFGVFHVDCMRCEFCNKEREVFYEEDGRMLCINCVSIMPSTYEITCAYCKQKIESSFGEAQQYESNKFGDFHPWCVKCFKCNKKLDRFYDVGGQMVCAACALPICQGCGSPAERHFKCSAGIFHPECYRCTLCGTILAPQYAAVGVTTCDACQKIKNKKKDQAIRS